MQSSQLEKCQLPPYWHIHHSGVQCVKGSDEAAVPFSKGEVKGQSVQICADRDLLVKGRWDYRPATSEALQQIVCIAQILVHQPQKQGLLLMWLV